jgi:hypothetical protein
MSQRTLENPMTMVIDLDERGWFKGRVKNRNGKTVFEFSNEAQNGWPDEFGFWLVEDGFMKHNKDTAGLLEYLQDIGIASKTATLTLQ